MVCSSLLMKYRTIEMTASKIIFMPYLVMWLQEAPHQPSACTAGGTAVCPSTNQKRTINNRTQEGETPEIRNIKAGWVRFFSFLCGTCCECDVCVQFLVQPLITRQLPVLPKNLVRHFVSHTFILKSQSQVEHK